MRRPLDYCACARQPATCFERAAIVSASKASCAALDGRNHLAPTRPANLANNSNNLLATVGSLARQPIARQASGESISSYCARTQALRASRSLSKPVEASAEAFQGFEACLSLCKSKAELELQLELRLRLRLLLGRELGKRSDNPLIEQVWLPCFRLAQSGSASLFYSGLVPKAGHKSPF